MKCNNCNSTDIVSESVNYKRFPNEKEALKYIQTVMENWEFYLQGFAEDMTKSGDWQDIDEVSLRGIADGLAESDAELADGTPNPDAF